MPEASPFLIPLSLPLSRSQLDRAAHLRSNQAALDELWEKGKIIDLLGDRFRIDGSKLALLTSAQILEIEEKSAGIERYFLGVDSEKVAYFVAHRIDAPSEFPAGYETLRTIGKSLGDLEIGAAVHALALSLWHQSHRRCAKCGAETKSTLGGSVRKCLSCEADHHPRTDPAVIVLVKDKRDRILLGRQRVWPAKRFSTFAGFVEPGESFERTVVREVEEECGGKVESMRYLGSQPWPFPASLMIAFEATITNPDSVKADGEEIEEIIWLDKESLKSKVRSEELLLPPKISVARAMIESWYGQNADLDLAGKEAWRN